MFGTKMLHSKKGFAYLMIVSIFVAVLLVIFLTSHSFSYAKQQELQGSRITTMNDFIKDFNEDIHRATFISAFRALVSLEDYVSIRGEFINNTSDTFKELFFNGTINSSAILIMNGSSFSDYLSKVNNLASDVGITSSIEITSINLSQTSPWTITVLVHAIVNVSDFRDTATWSFQDDFITELPIINLRDPIYGYYTSNKVPNTIRISPYENLVSGNNTTNLLLHLDNSYYLASNYSPSFLQRFEGNLSPSPYGIESIVDLGALSSQDISVHPSRIKVDFMYFTDMSATKVCDVENINSSYNFIIPDDRIAIYNLTSLNYTAPC